MNKESTGCDGCRDFWQFSKEKRPEPVTTNFERQSRLFQCPKCNSYWEEVERYAVIISHEQAKEYFDL